MSLFARVWAALGIQQAPATPIGDVEAFEAWMDGQGAGAASRADLALQIDAVHACWKVLSESVAGLPCRPYQRVGAARETRPGHWSASFFSTPRAGKPTPFDIFEWTVCSMLATGKSAWQIQRDSLGDVIDLIPLDVTRLKPLDAEGMSFAYSLDTGKLVRFARSELWLCEYFLGLSPLALLRKQLDEAASMDDHAAAYFGNSASPGGALVFPGEISDEEKRKKILARWNAEHAGARRAFRVALLTGGIKFEPFAIHNADAQFLQSRRYNRAAIAAIHRVPLHMINDLERATFSNIEHQDIGFVKHGLRPWVTRIEQSMDRDFLTEDERATGWYFAFGLDAILRGDYVSRTQGHATAINAGYLTPNEARAFEDLPPLPGGDTLRFQLNTTAPGAAAPVAHQAEPKADDADETEDGDQDGQ